MATIRTSIMLNDGMSSTLHHIHNAVSSVVSGFEQMQNATSQSINTSQFVTAQRDLALASQQMQAYEDALRDAGSQQARTNEQINNGAGALKRFGLAALSAAAAYLSLQQLGKLVNMSDDYSATVARISMMNDGMQTTNELQKSIYNAAQEARSEYAATASLVTRIGTMASSAFSNSREVVDFAELVQKQFTIAGTSAIEASNATLQLSQALASGVLRGDELNSIFEQAPNLIQAIADYLDVPIGAIRDMAADGELTAKIVKDAMFAASDDINKKFNSMPMTWSSIWTSMVNYTQQKLNSVSVRLNDLFNSQSLQTFKFMATQSIDAVVFGINLIIMVMATLANWVATVAKFFIDNWSLIGAVLVPLATSIAAIVLWMGIVKAYTILATTAQWAYNTAMAANPATWIIMAIVAAIAFVIYATYTWGEQTASVIGFIAGIFATLGAFIWNTIVGVIDAVIQFLWSSFVEPWISIIEWVLNVFNGGFDSFGAGVANLLGQIISWFLSLGTVVTKIIDAIFGTNWTAGLSNLKADVTQWGKNETAITLDRNAPAVDSRIEYSAAWDKGYDWGYEGTLSASNGLHDLVAKAKDLVDFNAGGQNSQLTSLLDGYGLGDGPDYGNVLDSIDDKLAKGNKAALTKDDIAYLRDQVANDRNGNFNQTNIKVDMKNENNINNEMDIDGVIDRFGEKVEEAVLNIAEGGGAVV